MCMSARTWMAGNANDCAVLPTLTKSSVVVFFCALDILSVVRLREFSLKKYLFLILAKWTQPHAPQSVSCYVEATVKHRRVQGVLRPAEAHPLQIRNPSAMSLAWAAPVWSPHQDQWVLEPRQLAATKFLNTSLSIGSLTPKLRWKWPSTAAPNRRR